MKRGTADLERLATLSPAELRGEWQRAYGEDAPALSPALLRLGVAYRWQEMALDKRDVPMARRSAQAMRSLASGKAPKRALKTGTRLIRSWNGRTIAVLVDERGFLFEDRLYRSLSAIAREVTGAHWSGPRFFGLDAGAAGHG